MFFEKNSNFICVQILEVGIFEKNYGKYSIMKNARLKCLALKNV
jgi:hypothetical protein